MAKKSAAQRMREEAIRIMGEKCVRCGYDTDIRALQIAHEHSNGAQEGSYRASRRVVKESNTAGLKVLCANCNRLEQHEKKEYWLSRKKGEASRRSAKQRRRAHQNAQLPALTQFMIERAIEAGVDKNEKP